MSPLAMESPEKSFPSAVLAAREFLKSAGLEITSTTGREVKLLPPKIRGNLRSALQNTQSAQSKDAYAKLATDEDRRAYLAQYIVDPSIASSKAVNKTYAINNTHNENLGAWLHLSEIGGPQHLNDPELAKAMADNGDLGEGRPSEHAGAVKLGLKQYWYSKKTLLMTTGTEQKSGVVTEADATPEQAAEVRDHIECSSAMASSQPLKRPRTQKASADSPRKAAMKKRRKELSGQRGSSQRKLKSLVDKSTNEMNSMLAKLPTLTVKGYPSAMVAWCSEKINALKEPIGVAQDAYTASLTWVVPPDTDLAELEADAVKCEKSLIELQESFNAWKSNAVAEVQKLLG